MGTKLTVRGVVFSALFGAILVGASNLNIHLGFTPVPLTLQNLIIMLTGAILGPLYGFLSIGMVVLLTAIGLPLLHGSGGLSLILGATGGYIWAYPFAAMLIGYFVHKIRARGVLAWVLTFVILEVFGSLLLYVPGIPWLAHVAKYPMQKAFMLGCYPYLLPDALKAVLATLIVMPVRRVFPVSRIAGIASVKNSAA